jgi:hypothetical protein
MKDAKESSFLKYTVIIILGGSTMIAHGLRMMIQGLFYPTSIYPAPVPSSIDFWFDWFTLSILGIIIVYIGGKRWMQWIQKKKAKNNEKKKYPSITAT